MTKLEAPGTLGFPPQHLPFGFWNAKPRVLARPPWGPFLPPPFFLSFFFFFYGSAPCGLVAAGRDIIVSYAFLPEVHLSFG